MYKTDVSASDAIRIAAGSVRNAYGQHRCLFSPWDGLQLQYTADGKLLRVPTTVLLPVASGVLTMTDQQIYTLVTS